MLHSNLSVNENGNLTFAGLDTVALAEKYSTPLYLLDENRVRDNCAVYLNSMKKYFGENALPIFASKSLCVAEMHRIIASSGLGLDIVSSGELFTAMRAGFPLDKVFFHGNNKTAEDIDYAVKNGIGYFMVDNKDELARINEIAAKNGVCQKVIIRVTPGIDPDTHKAILTGNVDSKFGTPLLDNAALKITETALGMNNISLKGFHCHVGSQIFYSKPFCDAAKIMFEFMSEVKDTFGYEAEIIDIGGGIGVRYTENDPEINIEGIIADVAKVVDDSCKKFSLKKPMIMMEPGRSISADAGLTLYTVGTIKEIKGYKNYVLVDGGMADNPRFALYQAPYTVMLANKADKAADYNCILAGRCCESGDIIQENIMLPTPKCGDIAAVAVTGAYNYSMASNYNRMPRPPIVAIKDGIDRVIVRRETFEDMCACDL